MASSEEKKLKEAQKKLAKAQKKLKKLEPKILGAIDEGDIKLLKAIFDKASTHEGGKDFLRNLLEEEDFRIFHVVNGHEEQKMHDAALRLELYRELSDSKKPVYKTSDQKMLDQKTLEILFKTAEEAGIDSGTILASNDYDFFHDAFNHLVVNPDEEDQTKARVRRPEVLIPEMMAMMEKAGGEDAVYKMLQSRDYDAFHTAVTLGQQELVQLFIDTVRKVGGQTALVEMMRSSGDPESITYKNKEQRHHSFILACNIGRTDMVKLLLETAREAGGNPLTHEMLAWSNSPYHQQCEAFHAACSHFPGSSAHDPAVVGLLMDEAHKTGGPGFVQGLLAEYGRRTILPIIAPMLSGLEPVSEVNQEMVHLLREHRMTIEPSVPPSLEKTISVDPSIRTTTALMADRCKEYGLPTPLFSDLIQKLLFLRGVEPTAPDAPESDLQFEPLPLSLEKPSYVPVAGIKEEEALYAVVPYETLIAANTANKETDKEQAIAYYKNFAACRVNQKMLEGWQKMNVGPLHVIDHKQLEAQYVAHQQGLDTRYATFKEQQDQYRKGEQERLAGNDDALKDMEEQYTIARDSLDAGYAQEKEKGEQDKMTPAQYANFMAATQNQEQAEMYLNDFLVGNLQGVNALWRVQEPVAKMKERLQPKNGTQGMRLV